MNNKFTDSEKLFIVGRATEIEGTWKKKFDIIAKEVLEKFNKTLTSQDSLRKLVVGIAGLQDKIKDLNDNIKENKKYEIVDGAYIIQTKRGPIKLTFDQADILFEAFTKHGKNFTGERMLIEFGMHPESWQAIKSALRLYKDSHVISPESVKGLSEDDKEEKILDATNAHFDEIRHRMVKTHEIVEKNEGRKAMKILANIDYLLSHLSEYVSKYTPVELDFPITPPSNPLHKHFVISDIHIGKKDTAAIVKRLDEIHKMIVNSEEANIHITILGDLLETIVLGGMHPGQIEEMDGVYGFRLFEQTVHIFEKFLISIAKAGKKVYVNAIPGNHDRIAKCKDDDIDFTGGLIMYNYIKRGVERLEIEFNIIHEKIGSFGIGNTWYVISHGDGNFQKARAEYNLYTHLPPHAGYNHTVEMSGDKHHAELNEGKNYTRLICPALAGAGSYDKRMNLHSSPGIYIIEENTFGSVDILLRRLP